MSCVISGGGGNAKLDVEIDAWDESGDSVLSNEVVGDVFAVSTGTYNKFDFEFAASADVGDVVQFEIRRTGGHGDDTSTNTLMLLNVRLFTKSGAIS